MADHQSLSQVGDGVGGRFGWAGAGRGWSGTVPVTPHAAPSRRHVLRGVGGRRRGRGVAPILNPHPSISVVRPRVGVRTGAKMSMLVWVGPQMSMLVRAWPQMGVLLWAREPHSPTASHIPVAGPSTWPGHHDRGAAKVVHGDGSVGGGGCGGQRQAVAGVARSVLDVAGGGVHVKGLVRVLGRQAGDVTGVAQQALTQRVAPLVRLVRQLQPTVLKQHSHTTYSWQHAVGNVKNGRNVTHLTVAKPCMPYILQLAMLGTYTPYIWQCQAWHIHLTVGNARHVIHLIVDNVRHGVCTYSWQCHACHTSYSWQCQTGHSFYSWQCQVCHTPYSWQQQAWCVYLTVGKARHVTHLTVDNSRHGVCTLQLAKPGMSHTLQLITADMACVPYSWQCLACETPYRWQHWASHTSYSQQHQAAIHITVHKTQHMAHITVANISMPYTLQLQTSGMSLTLLLATSGMP